MNIQSKILFYIIAVLGVLLFGTGGTYIIGSHGGFSVNVNSPLTALYFTIVTLSTVGYGDIVPVSAVARIFVIILIVSGLTIFLSAITFLGSDFMNSKIDQLSGGIASVERKFLSNHIVLIGTDTTNASIAKKLKKAKQKFIIITSDKVIFDKLREHGYKVYVADSTSVQDMKKFELHKAKEIIIDLKDNSRTVYSVIVARDIAKNVKLRIIATNEDTERHLKEMGYSNVINPAEAIAMEIVASMGVKV